jgi:transposase-like protein
MIYAATREEVEVRCKTFIRKWRLKHRAVADSLQEAGDRLFTSTRLPPSQWRSIRTTNAIERLHEEFKRQRRLCAARFLRAMTRAATRRRGLAATFRMASRGIRFPAEYR